MNKKLQQELKFMIGERYGKHEFDLDWVKSVMDNNLKYEVYKYTGKEKISIFDCKIDKILLAYNCDFLAGIFYFTIGDCSFKLLSEIQKESSYTSNRMINVMKINERFTMLSVTKKKNKLSNLNTHKMNTQIFLNGITVQQLAEALAPLLQQQPVAPSQPENDLMTRKQVCTLLSINFTTLWKHTKSGKLKSFGIGNRIFYSRLQVIEAVKPINK
ncbi:helix-turn-helix domain-containing protein [Flavobacterium sp.]|uniref:helix-turn-helix domain-containing protein n=1 Tax=Flavobacterium sp. TaxID=239 RepID=UPI002B4B67E8|nr:helix-turn-helix domain-containing protein [Flavobacterium sp.]HLF52557.1 helix-turn-helix domain-containing protein [Flavobacterium sp.]